MSQASSSKNRAIWILLALVTLLVVLVVFAYLEPVKTKRMIRQTYSLYRQFFIEKKPRQRSITEYKPIILHYSSTMAGKGGSNQKGLPVRLLDMEFETDREHQLIKTSVNLDGQQRNTITGIVPFSFSYHVLVPQDGYLWFGVNQERDHTIAADLKFSVQVSNESGTESLLDLRLPTDHIGWKNLSLDLSAFAGQEVNLKFDVTTERSSKEKIATTDQSVKAYWSDLFITNSMNRPNIFIILVDTLRPDHLGCYGYERPTSPNIDRLALEGVRFEKAFSQAPWTDPSILSLFTGLYPSDVWEPNRHKVAIRQALPSGVDTLAEILSVNGYFTVAASDHPGVTYRRFGQGFDIFSALYHVDGPWVGWRETDAEKILEQLNTLLEGRRGNPLLTYVHLIFPHQPYEPPSPYDNYFGRGTYKVSPENRQYVINMYDGEVKLADDVVGLILKDIRRLNLDNDSIVILLSDHGEGFWEHGLWEHGNSLYNELLHVPLIIHAPNRLPKGKTIKELVRTVDLLPTILDLVGVEYDKTGLRGASLLPVVIKEDTKARELSSPRQAQTDDEDWKRMAFSEFPHSRIIFGRSIQSVEEKLIDPDLGDAPLEYYEVTEDPKELDNQIQYEGGKASELMDIMNKISSSTSNSRAKYPNERHEPSEETIRKLKSLGYVQ